MIDNILEHIETRYTTEFYYSVYISFAVFFIFLLLSRNIPSRPIIIGICKGWRYKGESYKKNVIIRLIDGYSYVFGENFSINSIVPIYVLSIIYCSVFFVISIYLGGINIIGNAGILSIPEKTITGSNHIILYFVELSFIGFSSLIPIYFLYFLFKRTSDEAFKHGHSDLYYRLVVQILLISLGPIFIFQDYLSEYHFLELILIFGFIYSAVFFSVNFLIFLLEFFTIINNNRILSSFIFLSTIFPIHVIMISDIASENLRSFLIFILAFLPILNLILDYYSISISRLFLFIILYEKSIFLVILTMLLDFVIAIALLALMVIFSKSLIVSFEIFIPKDEKILWNDLISSFFENPNQEGIFVSLMLFTILLPTIIHFAFSLIWFLYGFIPQNSYFEKYFKNYTDSKLVPLIHDGFMALLFSFFTFISLFFVFIVIVNILKFLNSNFDYIISWLKNISFGDDSIFLENTHIYLNLLIFFGITICALFAKINSIREIWTKERAIEFVDRELDKFAKKNNTFKNEENYEIKRIEKVQKIE